MKSILLNVGIENFYEFFYEASPLELCGGREVKMANYVEIYRT